MLGSRSSLGFGAHRDSTWRYDRTPHLITTNASRYNMWNQHDAQLDYYGKRLATCSSDRSVKVFDVVDGDAQRSTAGQTLKGYASHSWKFRPSLLLGIQAYWASLANRLGTPKIRAHPRFVFVWRKGVDLEGTTWPGSGSRRVD